jgi:hypothetical protein
VGVIVRVEMSVVVGVLVTGSERVTVGVSVGVPVEVAGSVVSVITTRGGVSVMVAVLVTEVCVLVGVVRKLQGRFTGLTGSRAIFLLAIYK